MKMSEHLTLAKAIIQDRHNWTQGTLARAVDGEPTGVSSPRAVCFCAMGAIHRVCVEHKLPSENAYEVVEQLRQQVLKTPAGCVGVPIFNDTHEHRAVLALFDAAIETAKIQEGVNP